ncbi:cytochrome P450 [Ganoderma sinense ZZ0214-1]|uniref:Cytochrome P450 n=1 Tax=Ganoderma sinense ZZ0214-1 TaxID=1077348 RepID=A0A2G8SI59_9APHY|nr:cytochrome P450 [Ganoderma sinense ZZ0214-1]
MRSAEASGTVMGGPRMAAFRNSWPGRVSVSMLVKAVAFGVLTHAIFHHARPTAPLVPLLLTGCVLGWTLVSFLSAPWVASEVALAFLTYVIALFASVAIYRLSPFHPLAGYPGPALAKVTKFWGAWNTWKGDQHHVWMRLHRKYGPFIRTGPNELSIVDVRAVVDVFGAGGIPKGEYYNSRRDPSVPQTLLAMSGEDHDNRRRLWNRGMSNESLVEYEGVVVKRAGQLVDRLREESRRGKNVVDIVQWINFFTFDFMGDMAFGGGYNLLEEGRDEKGLWNTLNRFVLATAVVGHIPWAHDVLIKLPFVSHDLVAFRQIGQKNAAARHQAGAEVKDLWYHLSDEAELEKTRPSVRDVIADGALAMIAGADTTSSALSSFFYYMLCNPTYYQRLRDEIDRVYPDGADATDTSKHDQLVWTDANETLRIAPPLPTNGPRQVPYNSQGATIAERFVPPGTQVYVPPYILHRDPRFFSPSPDTFLPSRWLSAKDGAPAGNVLDRTAFIPFSYGPANCVGRQLARMEMRMVVSLLVQKFEFAFAEGFDREGWLGTVHDHLVSTRGPLMVRVTEREGA